MTAGTDRTVRAGIRQHQARPHDGRRNHCSPAILPELTPWERGHLQLIMSPQDSLTMQVILGQVDGWRQSPPRFLPALQSHKFTPRTGYQLSCSRGWATLPPSPPPLPLLSLPQAGPQPVLG
jgi:hypothetical protein